MNLQLIILYSIDNIYDQLCTKQGLFVQKVDHQNFLVQDKNLDKSPEL